MTRTDHRRRRGSSTVSTILAKTIFAAIFAAMIGAVMNPDVRFPTLIGPIIGPKSAHAADARAQTPPPPAPETKTPDVEAPAPGAPEIGAAIMRMKGRKSLVVVADDNYPPFVFRHGENRVEGYLPELWKLWSETTGVPVDLRATEWAAALRAMDQGDADVIDTIFKTPERARKYAFSTPYFDIPVSIFVDNSIGGIFDTDTLRGFLVGAKAGDACIERLVGDGIETLQLHPSYDSLITAARDGQVRVFCLDDPPANYLLYQFGIHQRFRTAFTLYKGEFHRAARLKDRELLAAVEAGFAAIPKKRLDALRDRWLGQVPTPHPYAHYLAYGLTVAGGFALLASLWVMFLRREVRRRTQELEGERTHLRTLLNTVPDLVWLKDPDGVYLACNAEFELLFGASASAIIGKTDYDFVPREMADFFRSKDREAMALGRANTNEEEVTFAHDGRRGILETIKTPMVDKEGRLVGVLGIGRDVTERKRQEERLILAARVFESTAEAIVIAGADGTVIAVNQAFLRITGFTEDAVVGDDLWRLLATERHGPDFRHRILEALARDGMWQGEFWGRRVDGSVFPQWHVISQVRDAHGVATHNVVVFSDITAIKESQAQLDFLAYHDQLTGLPNRAMLMRRVERSLERNREDALPLAILFIDLDGFKHINDTLGHSLGDQLLRKVATAMRERIQAPDLIARLGGDEFTAVMEVDAEPDAVATKAHAINQIFLQPVLVDARELFITASIGIAMFPRDGRDIDTLFRRADLAMYRSKERGRNTFQFFEEAMELRASRRLAVESALRGALMRGEIYLNYQPQLSLPDRRLIGVEALIRWRHPEMGIVPPDQFIPIAEESGSILEIGAWVLRESLRQLAEWRAHGHHVPRVAVNLSAHQIEYDDLTVLVEEALSENQLCVDDLELEITETMIMNQSDNGRETLERFKNSGVYLSIDDFGTGYSSLSRLRDLPARRVKIDQSFVRKIGEDKGMELIVKAIFDIARGVGLEVVAEGVETPEQEAFLMSLGCELVQGYHYGKPVSADEIARNWFPVRGD